MTHGLLHVTSCVRGLHLADDGVAPDVLRAGAVAGSTDDACCCSGQGCLVLTAAPSGEVCGCTAGSSRPFHFNNPSPNYSCPQLHFGISSQTAGSLCAEHELTTDLSHLLLQNQIDVRELRLKTRGDGTKVPPCVMGSGQLLMVQTFHALQGN